MEFAALERRRDPRTQTFVPITILYDGDEDATPAHLVDLSCGGAACLTTVKNSPRVGQFVELHFDASDEDGDSAVKPHQETGVVVNIGWPERGVTRIGVQFIRRPHLDRGLFDPIDALASHRKSWDTKNYGSRWTTARNFAKKSGASKDTAVLTN
jgi:c-di-GMP-binding flagellar brake protein YcgR